MGTRGAIVRKNGNGFEGRYHHWDSYPDALGKTLFDLYNGHFKKDLNAMLKYLIDDHPGGWSSINRADFRASPGFSEGGFKSSGPECYCHGGRSEGEWLVTNKNASDSGCEFVYMFESDKTTMTVLSSYCDPNGKCAGEKMIGFFGCGDPKAIWKPIAVVNLDDPEPDWESI